MKKIIASVVFILCLSYNIKAQTQRISTTQPTINENTIVKDSTGAVLAYNVWRPLLMTGKYNLRYKGVAKSEKEYVLTRLSEEEFKSIQTQFKPRESPYFTAGQPFKHFKERDMNGKKFDTKALAGKVIVLNFWFINCPPCRMEIPELNKIVDKYKDNPDVVFIAMALDDASALQDFLKTTPYQYNIIDNARYIAEKYGIKTYPTNVVVDKAGNVKFHSSGYGPSTPYWLEKEIIGALKP
jgi:thiol-disulfide isomerase/thioredoxin